MVAGLLISICVTTQLPLPRPEDVAKIAVETYAHPFRVADIPLFNLRPSDHERFLLVFRDAQLDEDPVLSTADSRETSEAGSALIEDKSGQVIRVSWYERYRKCRLHFSINGQRYIRRSHILDEKGADSLRVSWIVADAYRRRTGYRANMFSKPMVQHSEPSAALDVPDGPRETQALSLLDAGFASSIRISTHHDARSRPDLRQFNLPTQRHKEFFAFFKNARACRWSGEHPPEIGTAIICGNDGMVLRVNWYDTGDRHFWFSFQGVLYCVREVRGNRLDQMLRSAFLKVTGFDATIPNE